MKRFGFVFLGIACCLMVSLKPSLAQGNTPEIPYFEPAVCPPPLASRADFECGYLTVPENHNLPGGPAIRLMVAIAHSSSDHPAPDPVVVLVGGPGQAGVGSLAVSLAESSILAQRDIIYLDQRGTGRSEPNLDCPELASALFEMYSTPVPDIEKYLGQVRACRDRLINGGVNLAAYTSAQSAADVAALRVALGYNEWNLWGTSYGTRLALTVMRDHPEGIRSVILDSPYPPNADPEQEEKIIVGEMLDLLFDRCKSDRLCSLVYPHLRETYSALVERLNEHPALITVEQPFTGEKIPFYLDGNNLSDGVFQLISDPGTFSYLPSIIYDFSQQDYTNLSGILKGIAGSGPGNGLALSVLCSEEIPFIAAPESGPDAGQYALTGELGRRICENWLSVTPDPLENEAVTSSIPTLILVGKYDSATPPRWGTLAAQTLSRSYLYEFPGVGHVALKGGACPTGIMLDFLDQPVSAPDTGCIKTMQDTAFVVTVSRTRPWARVSALGLGLLAVWLVGKAGWAAARLHRQIAWKNSLRLMGWLPAAASAAGLALLLTVAHLSKESTLRLVEIVVPLALAVQTAFIFSPADEYPLEVLLACPRRPAWILLERWAALLAVQGVVALFGTLAALMITGDHDLLLAFTRWIAPALMLSGAAAYATIRSRMAIFGAAVTLLIWFGLVFAGDGLLPGHLIAYPFNYIQPWLWPFQPYLQPHRLTGADYVLNRIVVSALGIALVALAAYQLRIEEKVLLGSFKKPGKEA